MLQVLLGTLRTSSRRYVATTLAIVLGVAFATVTLVLSGTLASSVRERVAGDVGGYAAVVVPGEGFGGNAVPAGVVDAVRRLPGVAAVVPVASTAVQVHGAAMAWTDARTWRPTPAVRLVSGAAPTTAEQVVVSTSVAARADLRPGRPLEITDSTGAPRRLTVSGVAVPGDGSPGTLWGTGAALATWSGTSDLTQVLVTAAPGQDGGAVLVAVTAAVARVGHGADVPAAEVRSGAEEADRLTTQALQGSDALTMFLLAFAAVALFVSVLVIGNTFAILVAARRRQVALLRCVGATRGQVLRSVVAESLVVGVAGSLLGVGLGVALAAVVSRVVGGSGPLPLQSLSVPAIAVGLPLLAGTLVTVLAALLPARRATRVTPLSALRPDDTATGTSPVRAGRVRVAVAVLLVVVGVAALAYGVRTASILVALPGGVLSALGLLLGAVVLVPPAVRLLGAVPRRVGGVSGDLAVENAVRNPARAAAAASALVVGVTLITMMSVAASSAQAGVLDELDAHFPVDAQVSAAPGALTPTVVDQVARTDGVAATVTLSTASLVLGRGEPQVVTGVPTTVGTVLRSAATTPYAVVRPGLVVVDASLAPALGLTEGARTTLGALPVTVHLVKEPPAPVLAAASDLERAGAQPRTGTLLLRLTDADTPGPTIDRLGRALAGVDGVDVGGAAPQRAELQQVVQVVLLVVTGLLLVAVAIALVGVGNTLALSVLERQRESALLRALGLTRGQLRGSLALEAALLAGVAVVVGVAAGIGYGWAGAQALLGAQLDVPLVVPWGRLLLVALVALAAGVAAAWLPSRRAARVHPALALAQE
ncbi:FtsX-like permease family protein [Lapillicoccus jejuensis]|uniref:Putative ABC transport system permease protein n=1 Tax=Lapillicoccus jejuensis TaxID=402171 RepID=A0A542E203_9MICO|nr:ABC transporter permease [Lapillicoccus jejuensis]TQJ09367.1 putative ABC transport system permease protein [Lapillicoccus jejuensis]